MVNSSECILEFDGGSHGNPGESGCGCIVYETQQGYLLAESGSYLGVYQTNNYSEYHGLILGLITCVRLGMKSIFIRGDSKLVINQMNGSWNANPQMSQLRYQSQKIIDENELQVSFQWIPRNQNDAADFLAAKAISLKSDFNKIYSKNEIKRSQFQYNNNDIISIDVNLNKMESNIKKIYPITNQENFTNLWGIQIVKLNSYYNSNNYGLNYEQQEKLKKEKMNHVQYHLKLMCESLINGMELQNQSLPVSFYPPKMDRCLMDDDDKSDKNIISSSSSAGHSSFNNNSVKYQQNMKNLNNRFSSLDIEDSNANSYQNHQKLVSSSVKKSNLENDESGRPFDFQLRYLLAECQVYLGEYMVRESEFLASERQWMHCANIVTLGYQEINTVLIKLDEYFATTTTIPSEINHLHTTQDHNKQQLEFMLTPIHISRNHAIQTKDEIIKEGEKRRNWLLKMLNPQWEQRDLAKSRIGEEKWKNNLNPSKKYSEIRKEFEFELRDLNKAIYEIDGLKLYGPPAGRSSF